MYNNQKINRFTSVVQPTLKFTRHALEQISTRNLSLELVRFVAQYGVESKVKKHQKKISPTQLVKIASQDQNTFRNYLKAWKLVTSTTCVVIDNRIITAYSKSSNRGF